MATPAFTEIRTLLTSGPVSSDNAQHLTLPGVSLRPSSGNVPVSTSFGPMEQGSGSAEYIPEHRASIGNPEGAAASLAGFNQAVHYTVSPAQNLPLPDGHSSPRTSNLFRSLRKSSKSPKKTGLSKHLAKTLFWSPRRRRSGEESMDTDHPSGRRASADATLSVKGGFWSNFRPRSKSDCRNIQQATVQAESDHHPSRLGTITSLDEHGGSLGSRSDASLRCDAAYVSQTSKDPDSVNGPLCGVVDATSGTQVSVSGQSDDCSISDRFRARASSAPYSPNAREGRRKSDSRSAVDSLNVSPGSHHSITATPRKAQPRHSMDSFLAPNAAGHIPSAILYKTESEQFFIGNDITTLTVSSLDNENFIYREFMRLHKCYDLIPTSSKLVVFDTQLLVKKAFFALVYNGVRAAPLWDNSTQRFVGMLTITDFIATLLRHHDSNDDSLDVEDHQISNWKEHVRENEPPKFISIDVNESLHDAVKLLSETKVHRLPVVNTQTGNVLYILTHKRLLRFMNLYMNDLPKPRWMQSTPKDLGIGTWENIITIRPDTKLIDVLHIFSKHRISALPIVDASGALVDIYAKFDVISIAAEKAYDNLDICVTEALGHRVEWFRGVHHCYENDSLWTVIQALVEHEVHRMVITDDAKRVMGVVSLSDLLTFLVLSPSKAGSEPMEEEFNSLNVPVMDYS